MFMMKQISIFLTFFSLLTTLYAQSGALEYEAKFGQACNENVKCQKSLYCSYTDIDSTEGVCMTPPGRACFYGGNVYNHGETFKHDCTFTCVCHEGHVSCTQLCQMHILALAPKNCKHPRLVRKGDNCCSEWECTGGRFNVFTTKPKHKKLRLKNHKERSVVSRELPLSVTKLTESCTKYETEWSPCSKSCGWGISQKISNQNFECKNEKVTRFCQIRQCGSSLAPKLKNGKRCLRTVRPSRKTRFSYKGCKSRKTFVPKYCGECNDGRCCQPKYTKTELVDFHCSDGTLLKRSVALIKSCECKQSCSSYSSLLSALS